jgi:hypothetical protein
MAQMARKMVIGVSLDGFVFSWMDVGENMRNAHHRRAFRRRRARTTPRPLRLWLRRFRRVFSTIYSRNKKAMMIGGRQGL